MGVAETLFAHIFHAYYPRLVRAEISLYQHTKKEGTHFPENVSIRLFENDHDINVIRMNDVT